MNIVKINEYKEPAWTVQNANLFNYMSGNGEVLSGGGTIRYLDLEQTGTGHSGLIGDQYSIADYVANKGSYSTIYVRGTGTMTKTQINGPLPGVAIASSTETNPCRLDIDMEGGGVFNLMLITGDGGAGVMKPVIFNFRNGDVDWSIGSSGLTSGPSSIIKSEGILKVHIVNFFGGTIIAPVLDMNSVVLGLPLKDCVIDCPSIINRPTGSTVFANCVLTTSSLPDSSNCQFNWTPPTWPAWNASKESWASSLLHVGIETPPSPGNPPYTDPLNYSKDIWGNNRLSVGAFYFDSLPVAPTIVTQPSNDTVLVGATGMFQGSATGNSPITYEWHYNTSIPGATGILGETGSTLYLPNTDETMDGEYWFIAKNTIGDSPESTHADLTVVTAPYITRQPASLLTYPNSSVTFGVSALTDHDYSALYQWKKDGTNVAGATGMSYTIARVAASDLGAYSVYLTNGPTGVSSDNATLAFRGNPSESPASTVGMYSMSQSAPGGGRPVHNMGNANGNVVDNTQSDNPIVDQTLRSNQINQEALQRRFRYPVRHSQEY